MVVVKNDKKGTILVMAHDRGLRKPMLYSPEKGWDIGTVTADELTDDYRRIRDEIEREKLFQEAKDALDALQEKG